jgi:hypothetical protein
VRPVAEVRRRGHGHHPAVGDHADPVGQRLGLLEVVRGEQDRGATRGQIPDQLPELAPRLGVEAGRGLVQEEQFWPAHDAERHIEAALLAAGERVRAGAHLLGEPDPVDHRGRNVR